MIQDPTTNCKHGSCPFACEGYVRVCPYIQRSEGNGDQE